MLETLGMYPLIAFVLLKDAFPLGLPPTPHFYDWFLPVLAVCLLFDKCLLNTCHQPLGLALGDPEMSKT